MKQKKIISGKEEASQNFCKVASHEKNSIQYFCFDEFCFNKRLFCHSCAKSDHKKHRIGRIDKLIQPLSLLNVNSCHEDSQIIYNQLTKKMQDFLEAISELRESFEKALKQIEDTTFFQVRCILETFSNEKIQEVENLFTSLNPNEDEVRLAIKSVQNLQFEDLNDSYLVKDILNIVLSKMTKSFQKTSVKVESIFRRLAKNMKQNNFISELRSYKSNLEAQAKNKMDEGVGNKESDDEKGLSQGQTFAQQRQDEKKKNEGTFQKKRTTQKQQTAAIKTTIAAKFKAFFEQKQMIKNGRIRQKRDKNIILVKREY